MGEVLINIFKFVIFVLLIPIVIAASSSFVATFDSLPSVVKEFTLWGAEAFVLSFFFIYSFRGLYDFGQKMIESAFKFLAPLEIYAASLIPFYTVLIVLAYFVSNQFFDIEAYRHYFMFFIGFTAVMHVVLMAQKLQEQEKNLIKPTYFLMVSVIFVLNLMVAVLLLGLLADKFVFSDFFHKALDSAWNIYVDTVKMISEVKK